ncbi:hypothetical protein M758_UG299500 [Ceratodon purpureus]|nr:hypothetical protein M758_UG299500 [Ceratodon purpureus]
MVRTPLQKFKAMLVLRLFLRMSPQVVLPSDLVLVTDVNMYADILRDARAGLPKASEDVHNVYSDREFVHHY